MDMFDGVYVFHLLPWTQEFDNYFSQRDYFGLL